MSKSSPLVKPTAPFQNQVSEQPIGAPIELGNGITAPFEVRHSTKLYSAHPQAIRNAELPIGAKSIFIMNSNFKSGTCRSEEGTANYKINLTNPFVQPNSIFRHA